MIPDGGLEGARPVNAEDETLTLRVGREAYVGNFHLDRIHCWILDVAHSRKRAVLVHPYEDDCLPRWRPTSAALFRQSPLPVLHASERWLLEHCPRQVTRRALALQRVFEEADLLSPCRPSGYIQSQASKRLHAGRRSVSCPRS